MGESTFGKKDSSFILWSPTITLVETGETLPLPETTAGRNASILLTDSNSRDGLIVTQNGMPLKSVYYCFEWPKSPEAV